MSAHSPLFDHLTRMMETARNRLEAVDMFQDGDDVASRVWSRQRNSLMLAILAEPPVTLADGMAVLAILSEWRDLLLAAGEDMSARDRRDLDEVTTVALTNCNVCLSCAEPYDAQFTHDHVETIGWLHRDQERWLPTIGGEA